MEESKSRTGKFVLQSITYVVNLQVKCTYFFVSLYLMKMSFVSHYLKRKNISLISSVYLSNFIFVPFPI